MEDCLTPRDRDDHLIPQGFSYFQAQLTYVKEITLMATCMHASIFQGPKN